MCIYCTMGDHVFRHDPPWDPIVWPQPSPPYWPMVPNTKPKTKKRIPAPLPTTPSIPAPINHDKKIVPWDLQRLIEYRDLLREIKELEDKVGCPCEPNKADYLTLFDNRIKEMTPAENNG